METTLEATFEVVERSQVAGVRRAACELATARGLSAADVGRAGLVATELATNLLKYGLQGAVTLSDLDATGARGIQIVGVDRGPGMADIAGSMRDGHSTGGSLGLGLGVIKRASDLFDAYSQEAQGSAFLSWIAKDAARAELPADAVHCGARSSPKLGQTLCGDAWSQATAGRWQRFCVVDGLGHGPLAAVASAQAVKVFREAAEDDTPQGILERAHEALKPTRGAVMAVVAVDTLAGTLSFSGVGNIAGVLHAAGDEPQHLLSIEGTVGYNVAAFRNQEFPWSRSSTLVLSSDGLTLRRNLSRYPGLLQRHPALIAAVIHRDFATDTDDATVLVAKGAR